VAVPKLEFLVLFGFVWQLQTLIRVLIYCQLFVIYASVISILTIYPTLIRFCLSSFALKRYTVVICQKQNVHKNVK